MDTQMKKKTLSTVSPQSLMLAKQARLEQVQTGQVKVICPHCQEHPKITTTSKGERTFVSCKCGYVRNAEINF